MEDEIPQDWSLKPLGALGSLKKGRGGPKRDGVPEGVPVIRYGELYTRHHEVIREFHSFIPPERAKDYTALEEGDVLFAGAGETADEIGKSAAFLGPEPAHGSGDMIIFRPDGRVDPLFLGYASNGRAAVRHKVSVGQGSSIMHIYADDLEGLEIPLPPLPEQKEIAAILSSVDDAIAATRKVIEQTKRVKKGLLQELMTRGIGHTRFKKTEIGEIPEEWEVVRLGDVSDVRRGASPRPISDPKWFAEDGVGWIRISDVTSSDRLLRVTDDYLSDEGAGKSVPVEPGDVIMSIAGTIGVPVIVDIEACIHDGFVAFHSLSTTVNPDFLRFFIEWRTDWLESLGQRGTQKNLNAGIVKAVQMPLPTRREQDEIVAILLSVGNTRRRRERTVEQLQTLKRSLMQDLLTGRVRVDVD